MPALLAVVAGLGLGWVCGGRFTALSELRLRGELLIVPLFVMQALLRGRVLSAGEAPSSAIPVWVAVSLSLVVCLFLNLRVRGSFVLAMGLIMNATVVLANNGMPVSMSTLKTAGVPANGMVSGFYAIAGPSTLAGFAGDVMPVEFEWATLMISAGDVLLMVGVCTTIAAAMLVPDTSGRIADGVDLLGVA